jgi:hypothetical protein
MAVPFGFSIQLLQRLSPSSSDLIHEPREVYVEQDGLELSALEVVDAEGSRQIVILKDPLMLPSPAPPKRRADNWSDVVFDICGSTKEVQTPHARLLSFPMGNHDSGDRLR